MEQTLLEDLVIESIRIYGHDVYYMPMTVVDKDSLYGEVALAEFNNAYPVEMYIKNVDGFGGEGSFLSKFNLEIRDEIEFSLSLRTFSEEVGAPESISRPREGDLIWFPLASKLFKISYVNERPVFHQLGTIAFVDIRCQLYEYSNEKLNTGMQEIDSIAEDFSVSIDTGSVTLEDNSILVDEQGFTLLLDTTSANNRVLSDNDYIETYGSGIIDFTEVDPFSEGAY